MHTILKPGDLDEATSYPKWCGVSWFKNFRKETALKVEHHYHDFPEVYIWHEGSALAKIDGETVALRAGVIAYTATGAHHSYAADGVYSNTGIVPKVPLGCRGGHLHTSDTGESPKSQFPCFSLTPEENNLFAPMELPRYSFARHIACANFHDKTPAFKRTTASWCGFLVRDGAFRVSIENQSVILPENHLLFVSRGVTLEISAETDAEMAMVEGWPNDPANDMREN